MIKRIHKRSTALERSVKIHWRTLTCLTVPTSPLVQKLIKTHRKETKAQQAQHERELRDKYETYRTKRIHKRSTALARSAKITGGLKHV